MKKRADTVKKFLSNIYKLNSDEKAYVYITLHFLFFLRILFELETQLYWW